MKILLTSALLVSVIAISACANENLKVGSRDDIVVKNRGDSNAMAITEFSEEMPQDTAPLLPPEATMETETYAAEDVTTTPPVAPAVPPAPDVVGAPVQAVNGETIVPVTTPSVASGDIVVEVPESPVQTPAGDAASVANVVSENQAVDQYAPQQPVVTENQEFDTAEEALEEIVEETATRVSPYVPTY